MDHNIEEQVLTVVSDVLALDSPPALGDDIQKDLEATSLDIVTLALELEDLFGGTIDTEDMQQLLTVEDVVRYIERRMADDRQQA